MIISPTTCLAPENLDDPGYTVNRIFLEGFYHGWANHLEIYLPSFHQQIKNPKPCTTLW